MGNCLDRRVLRTRGSLQDALLDLILEKRYDEITVEEITDRAGVGRTTFYLHYKDKDALLLEVTGDFADEVQAVFLERLETAPVRVEDVAEVLFHLAEEHSDMYWAIISGRCGVQVLEQFRRIFLALFRRILEAQMEAEETQLETPIGFVAAYLWGAMKETIIWWKEQDAPYQAAAMVEMFNRLSTLGTRRGLCVDIE
ncbi:MAG: TetR/AcrR family transcriptional regulator [Anaerolineae bacterium]